MEGLGGEGFVGTGVLLAHAESAKREALPTYGVDGHGYASISTKQRIFEKRPPSLRATRLLLLLLLMMPADITSSQRHSCRCLPSSRHYN